VLVAVDHVLAWPAVPVERGEQMVLQAVAELVLVVIR